MARLISMTDTLSTLPLTDGLATRYLGRAFLHLRETDSTQNVAAEAGRRGEPEGLVVSADEQSAGRGRFRRAWVSPPGASLLVSILLRPSPKTLPSVVMIAALAVAQAIRQVAPDLLPQIKWPNDVLLNDRKVCGILVETVYGDGGAPGFTVLGIGLNVNWDTSTVAEIADTATSLSRGAGRTFDRRLVLQRLLEALETLYEQAKAGGDIHGLWRGSLVTLGRRVRVRGGDVETEGVAVDVDASGALVIRSSDGRLVTVHAGDVTLRE
jgi:BirA family biotin operon repressor/biotin-[acetyl-CoA-carboxylase] ligase